MPSSLPLRAGLAAVLLLHAGGAAGAGLSYRFVDLRYDQTSIDDTEVDADGISVTGRLAASEQVFLQAGYSTSETDAFDLFGGTGTLEFSTLGLGAGLRLPLNPDVDLVPTLTLLSADVEGTQDFDFFSDDDTGFALGVELRGMVLPALELTGGLNYVDIFDDDDTSFDVGALFHVLERLGLGATYNVGDDAKTLSLGVRVMF